MCCLECITSGLIIPFAKRMAIPLRAREQVMRRRSQRMDTVIILYFGTSARSLSYVDCESRGKNYVRSVFAFV